MHGPTLIAKYGTNVQAVWSHCFSYTNPTSQSLSLSHTHFVSLLLLSHSLCLSYFVLNALYHLFFNFGHLNTNSNPIPLFSLSLSLSLSLSHTHAHSHPLALFHSGGSLRPQTFRLLHTIALLLLLHCCCMLKSLNSTYTPIVMLPV